MNPFERILGRWQLSPLSQGPGNKFSFIFMLLHIGKALSAAAGNPAYTVAGDGNEVLYRLRQLGLENTFAYADLRQLLTEAKLL